MSLNQDIRVLIVDDSEVVRLLVGGVLKDSYPYIEADDGGTALEAWKRHNPDIILLDLNMPDVGGLEVINEVREKGDDNTYIIVLTALDEARLKTEALNQGANDFIGKPFQRGELLARLGVATRQVRTTRALEKANRRKANELSMLAGIQKKLLPEDVPDIPGVRMHSLYRPYSPASGDYIDCIPIGDDKLRVVIADVSGHGARAAFIMAIFRTIFTFTRTYDESLSDLISLANRELREISGMDFDFITVFAADIDFKERTLEYVGAGHPPALLADGDSIRPLKSGSPLIGIVDAPFETTVTPLPPDGGLLLYTDGFFDWPLPPDKNTGQKPDNKNNDQHVFGLDDFLKTARNKISLDRAFLEDIVEEIINRGAGVSLRDDLTALWVRWTR